MPSPGLSATLSRKRAREAAHAPVVHSIEADDLLLSPVYGRETEREGRYDLMNCGNLIKTGSAA